MEDTMSLTESSQPFDFAAWCRDHSCLSRRIFNFDGYVKHAMDNYGANDEVDKEYINKEFSLLKGCYTSDDEKVEIEDAVAPEDKEKAFKRLQEFRWSIGPTGLIVWLVIFGSGFIMGFSTDCRPQSSVPLFHIMLVLVPTSLILLWQINSLTVIISKTTFEGVPLVRFIATGSGFDNYYVFTLFALIDLFGKLTRTIFVGHVIHCSSKMAIDEQFAEAYKGTMMSWTLPFIRFLGFGGIAALSFIIGPIFFQWGRMLRSALVIRSKITNAKTLHGHSMGINECIDDHGAVADWAGLKPPAAIFFIGAVPVSLEDENDAYRMWDLFRTKALTGASNLFPDSVLQLWLMSMFFRLTFDDTTNMAKAQLVFSMFCTWAVTLKAGLRLIHENFVFTVTIGIFIVVLLVQPVVNVIAAFVSPSHWLSFI